MSRMELNIKGDPGSGNHYDDVHIDNVDNYTPNARTVVNNQGTTVNINLNVSINIDGQKVFNLFKTIFQKFSLVYSKFLHTHFGGEVWSSCFSLQIHLWLFIIFNAMDFNKVLYLHERYGYDGRRVVLRHKAFKTLVRQYSPDFYKMVKSEYFDLNIGLEDGFRSSV